MRRIGSTVLVSAALLVTAPAFAGQGDDAPREAMVAPGWIATLGFSAEVATGGAKSLLPTTFDLRRADEPDNFSTPDDAMGFALIDRDGFSAGPAIDLRLASHSVAVDAGAFIEWWPDERLRVRAEALDNLGAGEGAHVTLGSDLVVAGPAASTFSAGPRLTLGDGDYFRTAADEGHGVHSTTRFYAGATTALKVPVSPSVSTTIYDEFLTPLAGNGRRDGQAENTVGLELDFSFKVP